MAVNPMLTSGANSLQRSVAEMDRVAADIASMNVKEDGEGQPMSSSVEETAEAMVEMKLYQRQVQGAAKVIETAESTVGFLLDVTV
ncbi:MAG: hypothetical protein AAF513_09225 [Pseudomonadota bacterium]